MANFSEIRKKRNQLFWLEIEFSDAVVFRVARFFFWYNIPKREKYTKWPQNVPNDHKMYQMTTKCTMWPQNVPNDHKMYLMTINYTKLSYNIPTSYITRPSQIYPKWYFWFENIPSGNPAGFDDFLSSQFPGANSTTSKFTTMYVQRQQWNKLGLFSK
jgi:hypothetical protein